VIQGNLQICAGEVRSPSHSPRKIIVMIIIIIIIGMLAQDMK
jgi:hypothetical protein